MIPSRNSTESSAIITRTAAPPAGSWDRRPGCPGGWSRRATSPARAGRASPVPPLERRRRRRPLSRTSIDQRVARAHQRHRGVGGAGVAGHVGERLRHDEVRRALHLGRRSRIDVDLQRHRDRCACDHRRQRGVEPAVFEDHRVDAAHEVADLLQRGLGLLVRMHDARADGVLVLVVEVLPRRAQLHRQADQALLRAVVQVALDAATLGLGTARRPRRVRSRPRGRGPPAAHARRGRGTTRRSTRVEAAQHHGDPRSDQHHAREARRARRATRRPRTPRRTARTWRCPRAAPTRRAGGPAAPASRTTPRPPARGSALRAAAGAAGSRPPSTAPPSEPVRATAATSSGCCNGATGSEELETEQRRRPRALHVGEAAAADHEQPEQRDGEEDGDDEPERRREQRRPRSVNVTAPTTTSVTRWVRVHHVDA